MPLPLVTAMVFATWFGPEALQGIPFTFLPEGASGVTEYPHRMISLVCHDSPGPWPRFFLCA
ncbi:hypothetical protein [Vogesella sp. LIG4]|uniref:hypothetical protein n=1 Tax=Vogesella sp. LIG4 TaxID=1192162 RepID=UPI0012FDE02D|nr:hypothetical protein [Vogesella sp. LIG4]